MAALRWPWWFVVEGAAMMRLVARGDRPPGNLSAHAGPLKDLPLRHDPFREVRSGSPLGRGRAASRVEIPISAPNPNSLRR